MPLPRFSPEAVEDLLDLNIHGVLTYGSAHTELYMTQLRHAIDLYAENPLAAAERHEIRPTIRMFRSGAHHVFYDIIDGGIVIQRILHHSVDWIGAF